jgi:hypothetical protein
MHRLGMQHNARRSQEADGIGVQFTGVLNKQIRLPHTKPAGGDLRQPIDFSEASRAHSSGRALNRSLLIHHVDEQSEGYSQQRDGIRDYIKHQP